MGTSKGYLPPTGYLWPEAKRDVTSMVKNGFSPSSIGKAVSSFSKAMSGGGNSHTGSIARVGAKAVNFIEAVKNYGFIGALEKVGLAHLRGKSSEEVRAGLLEYFNDSGNDFYDSIAQQSMSELMRELLKSAVDEEDYNNIVGSIKPGEFIREFIVKFIQNCFLSNFAEKLLTMFDNLQKYDSAEKSVKTFIRTSIESEFTIETIQKVDWNGQQGKQIITDKCNKAFEILSVWSETLV
ncbi:MULTISPECIES: hypothetical protein [Bacillales]|uniref:Uncharacterized protein n=1 Tax=Ureibacillus massiliensis 4400831 = CIP 108448 = CCUG 49529 TaxID=1211035 RepID=A0A0A3J2C7_9BACL|nr:MULTISPECIES: hypothetical protein [Bacillales]KGR89850.1 hypothetical protein CD30_14770 [Ureibacillus massiliensis 4400831 = CIP 108448 = CCUG 49529]